MHRLSKSDTTLGGGAGNGGALPKRIAPVAAARLASTAELMGTGDHLVIPHLLGVPAEYLYSAGDSALIALARTLVELDVAAPEDWESAHHDPGAYVLRTIERGIAAMEVMQFVDGSTSTLRSAVIWTSTPSRTERTPTGAACTSPSIRTAVALWFSARPWSC